MAARDSKKRRAGVFDAEIGRRIRTRRVECLMSQSTLADRIGVSFQQVQKYEHGTNRVSPERLQRLCDVLQVPVTFFYGAQPAGSRATDLLRQRDAIELVKSFNRIEDRKLRRTFVELITWAADKS